MALRNRPAPLIVPEDLAEPVEPESPRRRRSRLRWVLFAAVLVAGSVGVALSTGDRLSEAPETMKLTGPARTFQLEDVRPGRDEVSLLRFRGKPVVLNFFGSWCPPCLRELPDLQAVSERYEGKVAFVGVTFNDTRSRARDVLVDAGVTYPAAYDPENKVALAYAIEKMPTTVFISGDGRLLARRNGAITEPQLRRTIEDLFFP